MPTFYCPICGYNLTGLTQSRCPECGREFDPKTLASHAPGGYAPITLHETVYDLAWPPGVPLVALFLAPFVVHRYSQVVIITAGVFLVLYGFANARELASRLAVSRAAKAGKATSGLEDRTFILAVMLGLYAVQLGLAAAGVALWTVMGGRWE